MFNLSQLYLHSFIIIGNDTGVMMVLSKYY